MMDFKDLLQQLSAHDIKVWVNDGSLRINAPQGALTQELKEALTEHKSALLRALDPVAVNGPSGGNTLKAWPRDRAIPLTQGQQRIWSLARLDSGTSTYNVPTVFRIKGKLDRRALESALHGIQQRHEALRTVFIGEDIGSIHQVIQPPSSVVLPVIDLSRDLTKLAPKSISSAVHKVLETEVRKPFDLVNGPLWRAKLFRLGPGMHILCMTMHHIIFDGVSKAVFLSELGEAYSAICEGVIPQSEQLPIQFADYAGWQQEHQTPEKLERQLEYWSQTLAGDVPCLVTPNQGRRASHKGKAGSVHFSLPQKLTEQIDEFLQGEKTSAYVFFLAVFNVLMNRYSGQDDLVVCSPVASRSHAEVERLIGYFNNIVVVRTNLSQETTFRELLSQSRKKVIDAFDNQFVPLQRIAQLPGLVRTQLTRVMLSYQDSFSGALKLGTLKTAPVNVRKGVADFDIALYLERDNDCIVSVLDYNADIFRPQAIKRLVQRYANLMSALLKTPDSKIAGLPQFGRKKEDIEKILIEHPQIDEAVLLPDTTKGVTYAYLVLNEHDVPSLDEIRRHVGKLLPDYRIPAAFIPVDQFPMLPDGAIDMAALPWPGMDRSHLTKEYRAPSSDLERQLALIWKEVLWLDFEVGVDDNFRELGGHSLLSVQLIVKIESQLGRKVPAKALAELNSVADLARLLEHVEDDPDVSHSKGGLPPDIYQGLRSHTASWDGERATTESVTVGLNTAGGRVPLFWCLQRYQELTQLAKYLGNEQPVYGMRSGNRVMIKTQDNIELLASFYVDEIREIQTKGPYRIGGNCQAAQIAFQIAAQMRRLGEQVEILFLHEKFIPFPYDSPVVLSFGKDSTFNPKNHFRSPDFGWRKYYSGPLMSLEVTGAHGQFFREPNVQSLVGMLNKHLTIADKNESESNVPPMAQPRQVLPEHAYRAEISASLVSLPKSEGYVAIKATVLNRSAVIWAPTSQSGLYLVGRWLDPIVDPQHGWDAYLALDEELPPGVLIHLEFRVPAPVAAKEMRFEIDMVDEGVARFSEYGSKACVISVSI